jgi:hypothetical protein
LCHGIVSQPATREALARAVEVWRASFTLLEATMDAVTVRADWTREQAARPGAARARVDGGVATFTLKEGRAARSTSCGAPLPTGPTSAATPSGSTPRPR